MTSEEAIKILEEIIDEGWLISDLDKCTAIDACEMAIEALKQEHCEDCVSRKAVFETIDDCNSDGLKGIFCSYKDGERFKEYIKELPPVTPQHEWIPVSEQLPKLTIKTYDNDFHEITISEKVLVTVNCKGNIYIEPATYSDRGWLNNDYVVAWKSLPEPYKSESEG